MRLPVAALAAAALGIGACGGHHAPLPPACIADEATYEQALREAPRAVLLDGVTRISTCLRRVRDEGELQTVGGFILSVGSDLALRARDDRDVAAAGRLGYLIGAVRAGAARSNGISAELSHRVDRTGYAVLAAGATVRRAVERGVAEGRARG